MKKCSCGKKMEYVFFAGKWYWVCTDCKIWDDGEK